ncbi:Ankyrin repeat domain-containing protein 27 [Trichoplax sp. H2]|nr:Ankyrin repeat domain-containing protein 27 [Trichoplax sp. H2]|eukprot:RDD41105.1 Ankyrin repeat domain-containing protein 27 [Trichoplax sp. H2]
MASEDLEFNPFYQALQNQFFNQLSAAQEKCFTICIPCSNSLGQTTKFSKAFVDLHILKPSPYVQGQYYATDGSNKIIFNIKLNTIQVISGFQKGFETQIIGEELGYNKKFEQYRFLLIEQPLDPNFKISSSNGDQDSILDKLKPVETLKECYDFLFEFSEHKEAMLELDKGIYTFLTSYVVVVGYLDHAAKKLRSLAENCEKQILERNHQLAIDRRLNDKLRISLESYILNQVHDQLFKVVSKACKNECAQVIKKCEGNPNIDGKALRLDPKFCCPLNSAIKAIRHLDTCSTPLQKSGCLKKIIDTVIADVNAHHRVKDDGLLVFREGQHKEGVTVTSDELISLLVVVIIRSSYESLPSHIKFIETFHWTEFPNSENNYSVVTFKAALRFILSETFDQTIRPSLEPVSLER